MALSLFLSLSSEPRVDRQHEFWCTGDLNSVVLRGGSYSKWAGGRKEGGKPPSLHPEALLSPADQPLNTICGLAQTGKWKRGAAGTFPIFERAHLKACPLVTPRPLQYHIAVSVHPAPPPRPCGFHSGAHVRVTGTQTFTQRLERRDQGGPKEQWKNDKTGREETK